jgi:hypothetical protein
MLLLLLLLRASNAAAQAPGLVEGPGAGLRPAPLLLHETGTRLHMGRCWPRACGRIPRLLPPTAASQHSRGLPGQSQDGQLAGLLV